MGIEYLRELQTYIGFECSTIKSYTKKEVGFSEFIDRMYACTLGNSTVQNDSICSCELGTGGWSQTEERYPKVTFLAPFVHDSMQTVTTVDNTNKSTSGAFFLLAFETWVWLAILGLTVAFVVLKLADARFAPISKVPRDNLSSVSHERGSQLKLRIKRVRSAVRSVGK